MSLKKSKIRFSYDSAAHRGLANIDAAFFRSAKFYLESKYVGGRKKSVQKFAEQYPRQMVLVNQLSDMMTE